MRLTHAIFVIVILLIMTRCNMAPSIATGGTETVNAEVIDTTIKITTNIQLQEMMLYLVDTSYQPLGGYAFYMDSSVIICNKPFSMNLKSGIYNLFVIDNYSLRSGALRNITLKAGIDSTYQDIIKQPGSVCGHIIHDSIANLNYTVMLKGTPFFCNSDSTGFYSIKCVPEGMYTICAAYNSTGFKSKLDPINISKSVNIDAGKSGQEDIYLSK